MDFSKILSTLPGIGSIAGGISGLLNGHKNPSEGAMNYLNQIPGAMQPYFQPYINAGQNALPQLQGQYQQMFGNPNEFLNNLGSGYKESPGYQFKLHQALQAGNNASAAGGMLGSPMHEQQSMQLAEHLSDQDYQDYLKNLFGILGIGQQGLEGINQIGYGASKGYGENLANVLGQQAQYDYAGKAGQNQAHQADWGNIFSGLSSMIPGMGGLLGGGR